MKNYKELQNGSDVRGFALALNEGDKVNLTDEAAWDFGKAFVKWLCEKTGKTSQQLTVAVGRDSRLSGENLLNISCKAMAAEGARVLDCSMASTPAMFMSCVFPEINADGALMITASHLPANRNGLKYFTKDGGLDSKDIKALVAIAETMEGEIPSGNHTAEKYDLMKLYSAHLRSVICKGLGKEETELPLKGLSVLVDAGNGAGGFYTKSVLEPLGANCNGSQFLEPDGSFPNHIPNPENKDAMASVCGAVKANKSDLGIIFDTDVDRAAAVDSQGNPIARNGIVALSAALVGEEHPGTTIVTDSVTSNQLKSFIEQELGLVHLRFKRGYKNVINKGIELNKNGQDCQLSIETSGHAALKENYFLDDGAYLATKIVIKAAKLKAEGKGIESCIASLKEALESKEYRLPIETENFAEYGEGVLEDLKKAVEEGAFPGMSLELPNYEGVRVNVSPEAGNGWFLLRKSLHEPLLPMNIESDTEGGAEKIKTAVYGFLKKYDKLKLV